MNTKLVYYSLFVISFFSSLQAFPVDKSCQRTFHYITTKTYDTSASILYSTSSDDKIVEIDEDDSNSIADSSKAKSFASLEIEDFGQKKETRTTSTSVKPKKEVKKKPSLRELSGYIYEDKDGVYDVPILTEPMWFQVQVVKNKEFLLRDYFLKLKTNVEDPAVTRKIKAAIVDAFVPEKFYPKFKGKDLVPEPKPLTAGALYLKVTMDPDVADFIGMQIDTRTACIYILTASLSQSYS
jgi:hypothetical protein